METIILKKNQPLLIPVIFKKTTVLNTTIDSNELDKLLNAEFKEPITLVQPEVISAE